MEFGPRWLARHLAELLPQYPRVRLCVAFSGGADSTALLAALARLHPAPLALRALHVDHGLQAPARQWSAHCQRIARALSVPLTVRRVRVRRGRGDSLEAAARAARYRVAAAQLAAGECLLTAHHQQDQMETVLLQLLRGAGLAGLAAMPAVAPFGKGFLVRPVLTVKPAALRAWLAGKRLTWVEDPSNADPLLDRSYLRSAVLPPLLARWPAAAKTVGRSAAHMAQALELLQEQAATDVETAAAGTGLSAAVLRRLPAGRRDGALRYWIAAAGARQPPATRLNEISGTLLEAGADRHPEVRWPGACVRRKGDRLVLLGPARSK
ncbi:MAG: tRNA lysidine(34) synthetase TilS [Proteobacteria bacterium]|nr:tRNA lysidine(34) synthetase TilS [Pseudomonadota bacterium]